MPIILLIRHGENEYVKKGRLAGRKAGVHLNDHGRAQAEALAKALADQPIKAVYASPLDRTMETATPLAEALKLEVVPRDGLMEVDFGKWQDKTLKELFRRKLWKTVQEAPAQMRFPDGESFAECQIRVANELIELAGTHKPKEMIACFGHSDVIKLAVAYFIGQPLDLFQRLTVMPASVSTLILPPNENARLVNLNHIPYSLPKKEPAE